MARRITTIGRSKDAVLLNGIGKLRAGLRDTASLVAPSDAARRRSNPTSGLRHAACKTIARVPSCFLVHFLLLAASTALAQVQLPEINSAEPITITAQAGNQWQVGAYEVWVLRGDCLIQQGQAYARAREAVLWIDRANAVDRQPNKVIAYLEEDVEVVVDRRNAGTGLKDRTWLGRFSSSAGVQVQAVAVAGQPDVVPPIYQRGIERRSPDVNDAGWRPRVQQTQYTAPAPTASPAPTTGGSSTFPATRPGSPEAALVPVPAMGGPAGPAALVGGGRRVRVFPRSDVLMQFKLEPPPPNSNQWTMIIDSGVNVIVDGLSSEIGTLDISTDRLVIWITSTEKPNLSGPVVQDERVPLEFYMEGNIVFREGERTIFAERMYYDVPNSVGTVLNADMLTPVRSYEGLLRFHAAMLQRTGKDHFFGKDAYMTSSLIGDPSYRLQSNDLYFEDIQRPLVDHATGQPMLDPATGMPAVEHDRMVTAANNFVFLGPVPVFYWPMLATDVNDPCYYIRKAQVKQDNVYGTQFFTTWNGYELLGIRNKPDGTDFGINLDYLGKRGFGHGGKFEYDREGIFSIPGHAAGLADYWGIQDQGMDNLGQGRSNVPPEKDYRYRLFWQHRQQLPYDLQVSTELGWISDRNFLEEYYKSEWDELKDESTGIELKRLSENTSWSVTADYRINDFFTQTNWLPRADHFWLGQPLFNDTLTWHEHSSAAYGQLRRTTIPPNSSVGPITGANGPFNFLPWEANDAQGERFATRQEIDWPFQLGPVKVVPYALGEAAHWGQDIDGSSLDRLFWQLGARASLPIWSVDPTYNSDMFNVHGLAHKVVFDIEFSYADSNRDLTQLPLYDPVDDDSVEAFRRRFLTNTFGIPSLSPLPFPPGTPWVPKFDERFYAVRSGLQNWVTSPSTEIADDLTALRLGAEQRWQTKRGPANNRRIIDWITLDTNITFFPNANRDNFGTGAGLLDYDFSWHVGDRLTLVSDAIFDFFDQGQKIVSVGGFLTRPPRGSLYAGFRVLEGPIDSKILSFSYSYWMSPKWVSSFGASIDLANQGNLGETFTVTRIGESFLVSLGFSADPSRDSVGVALAIEPRFLPKSRLGNVAGAQIPPAGAHGLE